jgi:coenzyme F420 hydrogenase subunit delta
MKYKRDFIPVYYKKPILILGCGNILFGDDGFGPAVVDYFSKNYDINKDNICIMDVGTGIREILFDLVLSEIRPERIIIIDAVDMGRKPGEVFEVSVSDMPRNKVDDFSLHQLPTSNLLRELQDEAGVEVKIIAVQVEKIPDTVSLGLSPVVAQAVPLACRIIAREINNYFYA